MNYYEILGVEKTATQEEISESYRKLARKYHPDLNKEPGAADKFKEVAAAFEVLNNSQKRADYDRGGSRPFEGLPPGFGGGPSVFHFNVGDVFGHHGPLGRERGLDIHIALSITLEEAFQGCVKNVKIKTKDRCKNCEEGWSVWGMCSSCGGAGKVTRMQGAWSVVMTCDGCHGKGKVPKTKCDKCDGKGLCGDKEEIVKVEIPAGIDNLMEIQLSNQGSVGASGRRGNLKIQINVKQHEFLARKGIDLICKVPVSYTQLVFGDKIKIPSMGGPVDVIIPPKTRPDKKLKLKGMGFPNIQNPYQIGDLIIVFDVDIPIVMPDGYVDALKSLKEWEDKSISSERSNFFKQFN